MIRRAHLIILLSLLCNISNAQEERSLDALHHQLKTASSDSLRIVALQALSNYHRFNRPDSSLYYGYQCLTMARERSYRRWEVLAISDIVSAHVVLGNLAKAFQIDLQGITIADENNLTFEKAYLLTIAGWIYKEAQEHQTSISYSKAGLQVLNADDEATSVAGNSLVHTTPHSVHIVTRANIAASYLALGQLDSAMYYVLDARQQTDTLRDVWAYNIVLTTQGRIEHVLGHSNRALALLKQSIPLATDARYVFRSSITAAEVYRDIDQLDSSAFYAVRALQVAREAGLFADAVRASTMLSSLLEKGDLKRAHTFANLAIAYNDSLSFMRKTVSLESIINFDEQERKYALQSAETAYQNKIQRLWIFSMSGAFISAIILAIVLYRNNHNKQKANALLNEQKEEIQTTLDKLTSTQSQLIQSEKMASLGELTAGIAHEIQNPLNFVNNFSELNSDLIAEMKNELAEGDIEDANEIADSIDENEKKISHHGKRADAIVKSMLQHSRTSSGAKEPTDINTLAEEYLRLAFHGLRAKDKTFNAGTDTEFDKSIGLISIVPQEIGRVVLNLITNAFHAVTQKKKLLDGTPASETYLPTVTVGTKLQDGFVHITVKDNGNGIPTDIVEKIYQPFFTTKPTGQGTGLGLSMSYDIVKAHGGEILLETRKGEGAVFVVVLPILKTE